MLRITVTLVGAVMLASGVARAADASPGLEAGGLAPPPAEPEPTAAPAAATEQQLARAEREDSGRGLEFFWVNGEVGIDYLGLQSLSSNHLVDTHVTKATSVGPVYGAGLGLRLVFITVGARFRYASFSEFGLWTLGAEGGLRIPLGSLEPYFTLGAGYASVGAVDVGAGVQSGALGIRGFDLRGSGGIDFYLSNAFSLGANVSGDILFLSRSRLAASEGGVSGSVYAADGSSVGAGVAATGVVGLHF